MDLVCSFICWRNLLTSTPRKQNVNDIFSNPITATSDLRRDAIVHCKIFDVWFSSSWYMQRRIRDRYTTDFRGLLQSKRSLYTNFDVYFSFTPFLQKYRVVKYRFPQSGFYKASFFCCMLNKWCTTVEFVFSFVFGNCCVSVRVEIFQFVGTNFKFPRGQDEAAENCMSRFSEFHCAS